VNDIVENNKALISGLIYGDDAVVKRHDFENLSIDDIQKTLKTLQVTSNDQYILQNLWKILYKQKPPTMKEFLTPAWIGITASELYPHVRNDLETFWSPDSYYRHLLLAPCIGYGKSLESALSILYVMTHLNLMKKPKQFFGVAEASSIVAVLGSFTLKKAKQTLFKPFMNILRSSPKFRRVKNEDRLESVQEEEYQNGSNKIAWTTASKMDGALQFSGDTHIIIVSDFSALLGLSIITGALSEISFFLDHGVSAEEISRMYNDLKGRVRSRFGERYFATTIMDSSPNSFESPIDRFVFSGEAEKDPRNYIVKSTHWDAFKDLKSDDYSKWLTTGETFPVFRGDGGRPPIMLDEAQVKDFNSVEIFNVPIDLQSLFKADVSKSVKDYCGYPSSNENKLISNFDIIEKMFTRQLRNLYQFIRAPADKAPEKLIWDQIYKDFFIRIGNDNYEFYRAPREKRWISVDMSEVTDLTSISSVHPELNKKGEMIVVADFTITIVPGKERMNIDSVEFFIDDLRKLGRFNIAKVTYDQYQSSGSRQRFKRDGLEVERLSVDITPIPYFVFISWIKNERIKAGRCIFLKNNLRSIQESKTEKGKKIIDHLKGKTVEYDGADWNLSLMGTNAKDTSDSLAAASYSCINEMVGVPQYQYEEINEEEDAVDQQNEKMKKAVLQSIYEKYSYQINTQQ
jgi:hypothetical protein